MFNAFKTLIPMMIIVRNFRYFLLFTLISISLSVSGQYSNRYREGHIIDKYGVKYSGLVKMTQGANGAFDYLLFKESDKSEKIKMEKEKLSSFVIEKDSFIVINSYKVPGKKKTLDGFAKVLLKTPNANLFELIQPANLVAPSASSYDDDKEYHFILRDKKLTLLTTPNFKNEMSAVVGDNAELKKKINSGELRLANLYRVIELYNSK